MPRGFDVIVIGSGFGGAVTACRLAESGARVLILERGRRWGPETYPRKLEDPWLYHHSRPHKHNGWLDLRFFKGMAVAQGAGVGGGSLCYSSVVMEPPPDSFDGWPREITLTELRPYYQKVKSMLALQPIPANQHPQRYRLMEKAAAKLGYEDRFQSLPLALSFDPEWSYDLPDALDVKHSKPFTNPQGQQQGTCVHLGNCDIGCDVKAKNTLDLNYVPAAESRGAEVRPLHLVRSLEPRDGGYRVTFHRIRNGRLEPGEEWAERVVVAAGSLGSTELLLRCRDQYRTLPATSRVLGKSWSPNANFLTPDLYHDEDAVNQGIGPTITAGLDFMDGTVAGERFYIEDDGFPNLLLNALRARIRAGGLSPSSWALARHLRRGVGEKNPLRNVMVWLGEGVDAADGELSLSRKWWAPWQRELRLAWDVRGSLGVSSAILDVHRRLSEAGHGKLAVPLWWKLFRAMVTVHPLGGCQMGESTENGVVDHRGQVFGYENLYVIDGAILPSPTGVNPSMTIAALAERAAHLMSIS